MSRLARAAGWAAAAFIGLLGLIETFLSNLFSGAIR